MSVINKIKYNKIIKTSATLSLCVYEIVCSRPSKQVWNLSASEVSQDQQFWDATVHVPMSLAGSVHRDRKREATGRPGECCRAGRLQETQSTIVS